MHCGANIHNSSITELEISVEIIPNNPNNDSAISTFRVQYVLQEIGSTITLPLGVTFTDHSTVTEEALVRNYLYELDLMADTYLEFMQYSHIPLLVSINATLKQFSPGNRYTKLYHKAQIGGSYSPTTIYMPKNENSGICDALIK